MGRSRKCVLHRPLPRGRSIDARFGTDGTVVNLIGDLPAVANDVVLQSNDRALVIGTAWKELEDVSESDLAVARYVAD